MARVVIALSGGVDSSVAAALLKEAGHEVTGVMLRLWSQPGMEGSNACCTPAAVELAAHVARQLQIPFQVIDVAGPFRDIVVQYFLDSLAAGQTPNPCLVCNRQIRWGVLWQQAQALGAHYLATGHYVRLRQAEDGRVELLRGVDAAKDQSYVLHVLTQDNLQHALFPVGDYTKEEIRALARQYRFPTAFQADSQDLCFLSGGDYRDFLRRYAPQTMQPGPILLRDGRQVGEHQGLAAYTIGQRKGLGVAWSQPLYVLRKDVQRNALIVGTRDELGSDRLRVQDVNWLDGFPPAAPQRVEVKIRYKARPAAAVVTPSGADQAEVRFEQPLRDITPGQAAVFYQGERVLGGGFIMPA